MIFFANNGFYTTSVHGDAIPEGAVEITQAHYNDLLSGQAGGLLITAGQDGFPILIDPPAPTIEDARAVMKCTAYQIRQALSAAGLRDQVEAAVAAGDQALQDAWHYAQTFERLHPKILLIASSLGQTDKQMDDLFILAQTLKP